MGNFTKVDYVDGWFLMQSPIPVLMIWVAYMLFVLKIGPAAMKNRPAFKLKKMLLVYNLFQVLLSIHIFNIGAALLKPVGYIRVACNISDKTMWNMASGMHIYFIAKVTELLDTVFFVLRKKPNQITFLHVYHHSIMVFVTWLALKFEPSHSTIFLGTVNSFIHVIMYTYYGLAAYPSLSKYLWWKNYITTMQLMQFASVFIHAIGNYITSDCPPSYLLLGIVLFNSVAFAILFGNFYIKSYMKKGDKENKNSILKTDDVQNGSMNNGSTINSAVTDISKKVR